MRRGIQLVIALTLVVVLCGLAAVAAEIGYITPGGKSELVAPAITAAGHDPVFVPSLSQSSLEGVEILWIVALHGLFLPEISAHRDSLDAFVRRGGILVVHDHRLLDVASSLPGGHAIEFDTEDSPRRSIALPDASVVVTSGPGGTLRDRDVQDFTFLGYALGATLPDGAQSILKTDGIRDEVLDFTYSHGSGFVYFSAFLANHIFWIRPFHDIYIPNLFAFVDDQTVDSDNDGIVDRLEERFGLDPQSPDDLTQDTDGDGLTIEQELIAGTDILSAGQRR